MNLTPHSPIGLFDLVAWDPTPYYLSPLVDPSIGILSSHLLLYMVLNDLSQYYRVSFANLVAHLGNSFVVIDDSFELDLLCSLRNDVSSWNTIFHKKNI